MVIEIPPKPAAFYQWEAYKAQIPYSIIEVLPPKRDSKLTFVTYESKTEIIKIQPESLFMPRPPTGEQRLYFRRAPAWCSELTTLVNQCATLVKTKRVYFPYTVGASLVNTSGIVQGTLELMAEHITSVSTAQLEAYMKQFADMIFIGEHKGLHFEERAIWAFHLIGSTLESAQPPEGVRIKWKGEYHYPLVIAVALLWFVDQFSG